MKLINLLFLLISIFSWPMLAGEKILYSKSSDDLYKSLEKNIYSEDKIKGSVKLEKGKIIFRANENRDHLATPFIKTTNSFLPSEDKLIITLKNGSEYVYVIQSSENYKELQRGEKSEKDVNIEITDIPAYTRVVFYTNSNGYAELPEMVEISIVSKINTNVLKEMCLALFKRIFLFGGIIGILCFLMYRRLKSLKKKYSNNKTYKEKSLRIFKYLVFIFVFLILSFIIESGAIFWLYTQKYEWIKDKEIKLGVKNNFTEALKKVNKSLSDVLYPHPYLGYVYRNIDNFPYTANNVGFFGQDFPIAEKGDDKFYIMITGGSAAALFAQMKKNGVRYLEDILNERYYWKGKKAIVLNGSLGAGLYPQQLIAFELYADVIDGVISIDGFNEFMLISVTNHKLGRPANIFDEINPYLLAGGYYQMVMLIFNAKVEALCRKTDSAFLKYAGYKITMAINHYFSLLNQKKEGTTVSSLFKLPENWTKEQRFEYNIELYKNYIRMMDIIAEKFNIKALFIIQPVPVIDKELTIEEKDNIKSQIWDIPNSAQKYLDMTKDLLKLKNENIPIYEILDVFKNCKETIYADSIHCKFYGEKDESEGNRLIAERIASIIEKEWGLQRK